ncbi:MAG: hypothetical protein MMC23_005166 [Stictis urceolatum]|nr:hypothetical protein [Stictis urceolata]
MSGNSVRAYGLSIGLRVALCTLLHAVAADVSQGMFSYPAPGSDLTFNYIDSVNVSWNIFSDNFTDPYLMLWLTQSTTPFKQTLVFNQSVKETSSLLVPLNFGQSWNSSNFNIQQGPTLNVGAPFFVSGLFDISKNSNRKAIIWNLDSGVSTPTSGSASPASSSTSSSTPSSHTSSSSSSQRSATVPVLATILSLFALACLILLLFFLRHRRRLHALETYAQNPHIYAPPPPMSNTPHGPQNTWKPYQEMPGFGPPHSRPSPTRRSRRWFSLKAFSSPSSGQSNSSNWSTWLSQHGPTPPCELHPHAHTIHRNPSNSSRSTYNSNGRASPRYYGRDGMHSRTIFRDRDKDYDGVSGESISPIGMHGHDQGQDATGDALAATRELQGVFLGHELPERTTPAPPRSVKARGSRQGSFGSASGDEEGRRSHRASLGRRDSRGTVTQVLAPVALGPVPGRSGGRRTPLERGLL